MQPKTILFTVENGITLSIHRCHLMSLTTFMFVFSRRQSLTFLSHVNTLRRVKFLRKPALYSIRTDFFFLSLLVIFDLVPFDCMVWKSCHFTMTFELANIMNGKEIFRFDAPNGLGQCPAAVNSS